MIKVEIFSQGEEVVSGQTVDTNAAWLSQQLIDCGYEVTRHTAVGDRLDDLINLLREIANRADICICSGGLGPTVDDLTALAVSKAFDLPLKLDPVALQQMQSYFKSRNRTMPESNRKQALLPEAALRLDNHWGTAPGFALQFEQCWFAFVPGVPLEMRHMFDDAIRPELQQRFVVEPRKMISLKTIGIGESDIQQRLQAMSIPDGVELGFCAGVEDVQTKLVFPASWTEQAITELTETVSKMIGNYVYAINGLTKHHDDIAAVVDELMTARGWSLTVIETLSHGLFAVKCRDYGFLKDSRIVRNPLDLLPQERQQEKGSIEQQATQMLNSLPLQNRGELLLLQHFDITGPALNDRKRSLDMVTLLSTPDGVRIKTGSVGGHRARKQNQAALLGLDFIRRYLQGID